MPHPAPTDTASLPLATRFHTVVLEINHQLGWEHDTLALELWRMTHRLTGGTAATATPYDAGHRETHRRTVVPAVPAAPAAPAAFAIHGCRALLRAALATAAVDPSTVADAFRILDEIALLIDP